eukprot:GHRQ01034631.1.p1 GENE.GHRQ01034631.1~~GHRQ01034631.1.p1  ORF type:complete len:110 (-),score=46.69 GHRQ01034631.1:193-522(-)
MTQVLIGDLRYGAVHNLLSCSAASILAPCASSQATFEDCFAKQYAIIHRLETNKLRNVAKLFAHLLSVDGISWGVLGCIRLTEEDTTSSSRIFIKYLFQVRHGRGKQQP